MKYTLNDVPKLLDIYGKPLASALFDLAVSDATSGMVRLNEHEYAVFYTQNEELVVEVNYVSRS